MTSNVRGSHKRSSIWIIKHVKRSFQSVYENSQTNKSENDISNKDLKLVLETKYIPPSISVPMLTSPPKEISSMFRRIEKNCTSFRRVDIVSKSNIELNIEPQEINSPEKCLKSLNYNWKSVNSITKMKRKTLLSNINNDNENISDVKKEKNVYNDKPHTVSKFTKRYLKMKLGKLFRFRSKGNIQLKENNVKDTVELHDHSANKTKSQTNISIQVTEADDNTNDITRNLSFTEAMMAKSSQHLEHSSEDSETKNHTNQIPSSALRFWSKPSEEKLKASQRRCQDNVHGSNELLLRVNISMESIKHPSELSLFNEDGNCHQEVIKNSNCDMQSVVTVPGYDKALSRYQNIITQPRHVSRKDRALSLAYDNEKNNPSNKPEMRSSQSSNNMSSLTYGNSVIQDLPTDTKLLTSNNIVCSPYFQRKTSKKDSFYYNLNKNQLVNQNNAIKIPPPPYDNNLLNKRFVRMRVPLSKPVKEEDYVYRSKKTDHYINPKAPKPPPRSDSLIRSFEFKCKSLTTSISPPRGDSFKMFKNHRDYENWLKNLPYSNLDKSTTILKIRSKLILRQCVSELLDAPIINIDHGKRRYSWPIQINNTNISFDGSTNKRASSLSKVKKKIEIKDFIKHFNSPSLCNYSKLYSLRNSEPGVITKQNEQVNTFVGQLNKNIIKYPLSTTRNKPSFKYKQMNNYDTRMTESCHESYSYSIM